MDVAGAVGIVLGATTPAVAALVAAVSVPLVIYAKGDTAPVEVALPAGAAMGLVGSHGHRAHITVG